MFPILSLRAALDTADFLRWEGGVDYSSKLWRTSRLGHLGTVRDNVLRGNTDLSLHQGGNRGSDQDDFMEGYDGKDMLYSARGDDVVVGTDNGNFIVGGPSVGDTSTSDNDCLYGFGGNDSLYGGDGFDLLDGGAGDDLLLGQAGDDKLATGDGNDIAKGGLGRDIIITKSGVDYLWGGGDDVIDRNDHAADTFVIHGATTENNPAVYMEGDSHVPVIKDFKDIGDRIVLRGDARHFAQRDTIRSDNGLDFYKDVDNDPLTNTPHHSVNYDKSYLITNRTHSHAMVRIQNSEYHSDGSKTGWVDGITLGYNETGLMVVSTGETHLGIKTREVSDKVDFLLVTDVSTVIDNFI